MSHPLRRLLLDAAAGRPPHADGRVDVVGSTGGPTDAVVAFTGHSVVALDVDPDDVARRLDPYDPGASMDPAFLMWLGGWTGRLPGIVDAVLAAPRVDGPPPIPLEPADELDHPRVVRASRYREDLRVFGAAGGVLVLGRGLAGRWEAAFEVDPERRGQGIGRALAAAAQSVVEDDAVFVQVSPGNAASLRAVLAAGYRPVGAEVLFPLLPPTVPIR